jgi:hypothetical protein
MIEIVAINSLSRGSGVKWEALFPEDLQQWLLDGEPWVRYRTLTWLMERSEENRSVVKSRTAVPNHQLMRRILDSQNKDGYWGGPKDIHTWWPKKDTTFWILPVLGDFGFTVENRRVEKACEYVLSTQLESGAFGWSPPSKPGDCHTAILTESLAKLGLLKDSRLQAAYDYLIERQRSDGGFWCKDTGQLGEPREKEPSCAMSTMFVLGAFAQNPKLKKSKVAASGVDFLFDCWKRRENIKYAGHDSQIGVGWEKLKYPFTEYRILKFLDVLSRFESARERLRESEMVDILLSKRNEEGRFTPESIHLVWSDFDFGQKKEPSRWVTLLALRVLKRIYE